MAQQTNGISPQLAAKYLALDNESTAELLEKQMAYMGECREVREVQKRHFEMAVAEGMPADAWRAYLKEHRIKAKAAKQIENIYADAEDGEVRDSAAMIREALGADYASLPLGAVAVARGAPGGNVVALAGRKGGRAKKGAPLVGEDTGAAPKMGADADDIDLRGTRQKAREAEVAEQLKGVKPLPN